MEGLRTTWQMDKNLSEPNATCDLEKMRSSRKEKE